MTQIFKPCGFITGGVNVTNEAKRNEFSAERLVRHIVEDCAICGYTMRFDAVNEGDLLKCWNCGCEYKLINEKLIDPNL